MEVIYWQLVVAGSTAAAYFFHSRVGAAVVAGLWTIWTIVILSHMPLVILQLLSAWGTFYAIDKFTLQSRHLAEFKSLLSGFPEDEKNTLLQARTQGKHTLLSDSSHYDYMLEQIENAINSAD